MNVLLLAGAGTSIDLGVPAMSGLAEEFLEHTEQWDVEPDLVRKIMGDSMDVEHLIEELDHICTASTSLEAVGQDLGSLDRFDKVRAEVEWFIQHAAERITARDAHLLWGPVLRAAEEIDLTLVTTNYDRAIELAANAEELEVDDGFGTFDDGETAPWIHCTSKVAQFILVKLHGSTDWYSDGLTGAPTKLRHPMPLFGRGILRLPSGQELGSALVLPSREKLLTREPYPRLSQTFLNASDRCDVAIFIGSSLRDHHIRGAAQTVAQRVPVFIVTPSGSTHGVEEAIGVAQCASTFLIATLPNALLTSTPIDALQTAATQDDEVTGSVFLAARQALDPDASTAQRCHAIDELDAMSAALDPALMEQLLDDPDATVARYALGLVPLSARKDLLVQSAQASAHVANAAYDDDLSMLTNLISS